MDDITQMGMKDLMGLGESEMILNLPESSEDLQRSKEWFKARLGRFTGSKKKELMSCNRAAAKMSWNDVDKIFEFGETAIIYIYGRAQERLTGISPQMPDTWQMRWGKYAESEIVKDMLKREVIQNFKECGFELFQEVDYAGASPDGIVVVDGVEMGLEIKACVSWDGHFKRMEVKVHDKHDDFWQIQSEMMTLGLNELLYVVAKPMEVNQYDMQIVKASPIHQKAIERRCEIANAAIEMWNKDRENLSLRVAIETSCANYKLEDNE